MAEKMKINWLLILQGWAMLWVVIGHAPLGAIEDSPAYVTVLYHIAYSFHMPLFMLVSGWLFYLTRLKIKETRGGRPEWTYTAIVRDKVLRLLLPGLFFSIIAFSVKIFFPGEVDRQQGLSFSEIVHVYLYPYDNPLRELWFIATLFWYFVLTPFWESILRKNWSKWILLGLLLFLCLWNPNIELLCIGRVLSYAIWFYLGVLISKENWVEEIVEKWPWKTLLAGAAVYIVGRNSITFVATMGGIIFSFAFAILADMFIPRLLGSFRNYTYQIFLMGIFAQILVKILYRHLDIPYLTTFLCCIIVGLYVPVLVSKVLEKIDWKPLLMCVGLKTVNKKSKS